MHIISDYPELLIFKQEPSTDFSPNTVLVSGHSMYNDIVIGQTYDCLYQLADGIFIEDFKAKIIDIDLNGVSTKVLPKNRGGKIQLELNGDVSKFINLILKQKVSLSQKQAKLENTFLDNVVNIDPVNNEGLIGKALEGIDKDSRENCRIYIGKAIEKDIHIDQKVDVVWDMLNPSEIERCDLRIIKIFSKNMKLSKQLIKGVPYLIVLKAANPSMFYQSQLLSLKMTKGNIMLGKEIQSE